MTQRELLKYAQELLAENTALRKRLAETNTSCECCGKPHALYCLKCCEDSIVQTAVKEEREACAQIAARWDDDVETRTKPSDAIRARGNDEVR